MNECRISKEKLQNALNAYFPNRKAQSVIADEYELPVEQTLIRYFRKYTHESQSPYCYKTLRSNYSNRTNSTVSRKQKYRHYSSFSNIIIELPKSIITADGYRVGKPRSDVCPYYFLDITK